MNVIMMFITLIVLLLLNKNFRSPFDPVQTVYLIVIINSHNPKAIRLIARFPIHLSYLCKLKFKYSFQIRSIPFAFVALVKLN